MKKLFLILRITITLVLLYLVVSYVSAGKLIEVLKDCDIRYIFMAFVLIPLMLYFRMMRWYVLVRQTGVKINKKSFVAAYLYGMAVGSVTPIRLGEITRLSSEGFSFARTGLFMIEKFIGMYALFLLSCITLFYFRIIPVTVTSVILIFLILTALFWKKGIIILIRGIRQVTGYPSGEIITQTDDFLKKHTFKACVLFALSAQFVFAVQTYLVIRSMHQTGFSVILLIFTIHVANLLPITIGGFGLREALAVIIFRISDIPDAIAASSVMIAVSMDIFLPGIIGLVLHLFSSVTKKKASLNKT